jgi:hypothetical protein
MTTHTDMRWRWPHTQTWDDDGDPGWMFIEASLSFL